MTRTCTICDREDVEEINKRLLTDESYRSIAKHFEASESAVYRHKESHIPDVLAKSEDAKEVVNADMLFQKVEEEALFVREMRVLAATEGNIELALKAVDRALKCIELYAKIDGLIKEQNINIIQQNVLINSPEWVSLRTLIVKALEPYPQAREAVARAIGA